MRGASLGDDRATSLHGAWYLAVARHPLCAYSLPLLQSLGAPSVCSPIKRMAFYASTGAPPECVCHDVKPLSNPAQPISGAMIIRRSDDQGCLTAIRHEAYIHVPYSMLLVQPQGRAKDWHMWAIQQAGEPYSLPGAAA